MRRDDLLLLEQKNGNATSINATEHSLSMDQHPDDTWLKNSSDDFVMLKQHLDVITPTSVSSEFLTVASSLADDVRVSNKGSPMSTNASFSEHSQSMSGGRSMEKPLLLLHIGPPKTATTTIQEGLAILRPVLQRDGISNGNAGHIASGIKRCGKLAKRNTTSGIECWSKVREDIRDIHLQKNQSHILISSEPLSIGRLNFPGLRGQGPVDWMALKDNLGDQVDIVIILGYRRFFEWLPSAFQQIFRWTPAKNKLNAWPGQRRGVRIPEPILPNNWKSLSPRTLLYSNVMDLVRSIDGHLPVVLFNLHDHRFEDQSAENKGASVLSRFICQSLVEAGAEMTHSCSESLARDRNMTDGEVVLNPEQTLFYDALVVAAWQKGLVRDVKLLRHNVAKRAEEFQTQVLNETFLDFPVTCPLREEYEAFLNYSLQMEAEILPKFYASPDGRAEHEITFWKRVDKKKYCWIDTETLLVEQRWINFFSNLHTSTAATKHQHSGKARTHPLTRHD